MEPNIDDYDKYVCEEENSNARSYESPYMSLHSSSDRLERGAKMIISPERNISIIGEYQIVMCRYFELKDILYHWGEPEYRGSILSPNCSKSAIIEQVNSLEAYRKALENRAIEEGIDLLA